MKVPHSRSFDHDNDFFLLEHAEWAHTDTGRIELKVTIKDTNDDNGYTSQSYQYHLQPGERTGEILRDLMSYDKDAQKKAWQSLGDQTQTKHDPEWVNNSY